MIGISNVTATGVKSSPDLAMLKSYAMCNLAADASRRGDVAQANTMLAHGFGDSRIPRDPSRWSLRARVERSQKRYADATTPLAAYHAAVSYVRRAGFAGDMLLRQRRYGEALVAFDRGIRFDHGSPDLHRGRGDVLRALGRLSEARVAVQRGLAADPADKYCKKTLARIESKG